MYVVSGGIRGIQNMIFGDRIPDINFRKFKEFSPRKYGKSARAQTEHRPAVSSLKEHVHEVFRADWVGLLERYTALFFLGRKDVRAWVAVALKR